MADATDELNRFADRMGMTTAAAEDLFKRLRDLNRSADGTVSAFDATRDATSRLSYGQRDALSAVRSFGTSVSQTARSLASMPEQIAASNSALNSITPVISTITGFAGQLSELTVTGIGAAAGSFFGKVGILIGTVVGKKLGELTNEIIQAVGGVINFFLRQAQNVIDSFTQLSSVGATFGGSLTRLKDLSRETGLSFETLSKIAVSNAENLALLGGGTQGALKLVTTTSNNLGNTLLALYGGFENLNAETAEYMAMRRRQGIIEMATGTQLTQQTGEYLYMMKELSALTGKNAKQLRSEIEQRTRNAAAQLVLSEMTEEERNNFNYQLSQLPEGLRNVYTDMVVAARTGNTAVSEETLRMSATMPGITNKLENMVSTLGMAPVDMKERFGREAAGLVEETRNYRQQFRDQLYLFTAGRISSDVIRNIDTALTSLGENLGRLKTLPEDIKTFAEQTTRLKNNAESFVDTVGQITREQEKIRIALNNLATDGERFNLTLALTNFTLQMTEAMIEEVNRILPNFARTPEMPTAQRDSVREDVIRDLARTNPSQIDIEINRNRNAIAQIGRQISDLINEMSTDGLTSEVRATYREQISRNNSRIAELEAQIRRFEEMRNRTGTVPGGPNASSVQTSSTEKSNTNATPLPVITASDTKLSINFTELVDVIKPIFDNQITTNRELALAMDNQTSQFRRLLDRIG
jgi:hypothetical protein